MPAVGFSLWGFARLAELNGSMLAAYREQRWQDCLETILLCRDAGRPFLTEAAICKILSSEVAESVSSLAINLFGGNGFVKEYPVEKLYRDAKIGQIYEGTSNMQLQTIAKMLIRERE